MSKATPPVPFLPLAGILLSGRAVPSLSSTHSVTNIKHYGAMDIYSVRFYLLELTFKRQGFM